MNDSSVLHATASTGGNVFMGPATFTGTNNIGGLGGGGARSGLRQDCLRVLSTLVGSSPEVRRTNIAHSKTRRTPGTCKWIFQNDMFKTWLRSDSAPLWLCGGPGKGKTMLSIYISEMLEQSDKIRNSTTIFFFCDRLGQQNTPSAIVNALIFQMLTQHSSLFVILQETFETRGSAMFDSSEFPMLWTKLELMVDRLQPMKTFCVIDGLDECDEHTLEPLFRMMEQASSAQRKSVQAAFRLLISARQYPSYLAERLEEIGFLKLDLESTSQSGTLDDVDMFIQAQIDQFVEHKHLNDQLRDKIAANLRSRSEGTFLWVGLMTQQLKRKNPLDVSRALQSLPKGLDHLYERLLGQIHTDWKERAVSMMQYVALAARQLSLDELVYFIDQRPLEGYSAADTVAHMADFCQGLLRYHDGKIYLIHSSVRDYLLAATDPRMRIDERLTHTLMAQRCLDTIEQALQSHEACEAFDAAPKFLYYKDQASKPDFEALRDSCDTLRERNLLLEYAAQEWNAHACRTTDDIYNRERPIFGKVDIVRRRLILYLTVTNVRKLCRDCGGVRSDINVSNDMHITIADWSTEIAGSAPLLSFAIQFRAFPLFEKALQRARVAYQDSNRLTAFHRICGSPLEDTLRSRNKGSNYPFDAAWRSKDALPALVNSCDDTDDVLGKQNVHGMTAIHVAIFRRKPNILRYLLLHLGPNSSALRKRIPDGDTPLFNLLREMASAGSVEDEWLPSLVIMLQRMNIRDLSHSHDIHGMTALYFCSRYTSAKTTRTVLEAGADPRVPVMVPYTFGLHNRKGMAMYYFNDLSEWSDAVKRRRIDPRRLNDFVKSFVYTDAMRRCDLQKLQLLTIFLNHRPFARSSISKPAVAEPAEDDADYVAQTCFWGPFGRTNDYNALSRFWQGKCYELEEGEEVSEISTSPSLLERLRRQEMETEDIFKL